MNNLRVFTGNANPALAEEICQLLGIALGSAAVTTYEDQEISVQIQENIRGKDVFIVQSTNPPAENLLELLLMIDAAKRASAKRITAVIPYFGYACQDKKDEPRVPISAKLVADLLTTAGAGRVLTMDLHAGQIQGFFNIPVDHLFASPLLVKHVQKFNLSNLVAVSPDAGRAKLVRIYAKMLGCSLVLGDKRKEGADRVEVVHLIGEVQGKTPVIFDDMIRTASTIEKVVQALRAEGLGEITIAATHPDFTEKAILRLSNPAIKKVIVTNTIRVDANRIVDLKDKIEFVSVAGLFAEAIKRIHKEESLTELFPKVNPVT